MKILYLFALILAVVCELAAALPTSRRRWGLTTRPKWGVTTPLTWGPTVKPYWGTTTKISWGTTVKLGNMVDVEPQEEAPVPVPNVAMYRNGVSLEP